MSWIIPGELFPQAVRPAATAVALAANGFMNAANVVVFWVLLRAGGVPLVFAAYGAANAAFAYAVHFTLPETSGKTLEQLERDVYRRLSQVSVASSSPRSDFGVGFPAPRGVFEADGDTGATAGDLQRRLTGRERRGLGLGAGGGNR